MKNISTCVVCGCTDTHACPGGCSWAVLFEHGRAGVCSNCTKKFMVIQARAHPDLRGAIPVVLYLPNRKAAQELIQVVLEVHPGMKAEKLD